MRDAGVPCNGLSKAFKLTADLRAVEIFRAPVVPGYAGAPGQFRNGIDGKHRPICREALTPDLGSMCIAYRQAREGCAVALDAWRRAACAPRLKKMGNASSFRVGWRCVERFFRLDVSHV